MNIPFAYAKINFEGELLQYNDKFAELLDIKKEKSINQILENFNLEKEQQHIIIKNSSYCIFSQKNQEDDTYYLFFIKLDFMDEYKISIGLIFIDNYDEILDSIEEFRHPLIIAILDRKVKKFAKDLGGIVKKFEKDKYIFVLTNEKIDKLKQSKFEILDNVREIDLGNTLPLTLSMGIGLNGTSLDQNMEFARVAVDLALSRGGDQVVIKSNENYQFFGGNSKEIIKNSRVRARVKAYALTELIEEAANVIIMGHKNIDLDCLGAAVGVYSIVHGLDKKCNIVLNAHTPSVSILYERLKNEEKYKRVFISSDEAFSIINKKTLLIIVDTYKPDLCECTELIEKCKKVVVFDHHRKGVSYIEKAVLTYHEPACSSTCELITEMLMYINKTIPLKNVEADALLSGIILDTKNFAFKTGVKTFETAAFLKKRGADTVRVKALFKNSIEEYSVKSSLVKDAEIFQNNIAISILNTDVLNPLLIIAQAADDLLSIDNIDASFVLYSQGGNVFISARSFDKINVQEIMESLGGGGHKLIAAAQLKDTSIDSAISLLKETIKDHIKES